jgi:broad specificity phosphatase PhoE
MPATIHLVRHAQGFHNLSAANEAIPDPLLTPLGKTQCADLRKSFPYHDKLTHLVASPMRRTIYTCLEAFGSTSSTTEIPKLKIAAVPEIQEISDAPCDTGSAPEILAQEFGGLVDLSLVHEGWNDKSEKTEWEPTLEKLEVRARTARILLRDLVKDEGDAHVVVVSHGGLVHFLTEDWSGLEPHRGT